MKNDLDQQYYTTEYQRSNSPNKTHNFDSYICRDTNKLLHQKSPHEKRFETIDKFPKILSLNTKISSKIDFKPMVSRKFNEVFKPNPTSKGLAHFNVKMT